MQKLLSILISLWVSVANFRATAAVRIAVVTDHQETRLAGDLLTAALSKVGTFDLIERDEIDKVVHERTLSGAQHSDILRAGRVLNADGLVFLERITTAQATNVGLRVVAIRTGVLFGAGQYSLPQTASPEWSKVAASQIVPLVPKLSVDKGSAVPISILNLRAAVATPEDEVIERGLSALLLHRLAIEPAVFPLERKKLGHVELEKSIAQEQSEFWSGGYLLEGVIERESNPHGKINIECRLKRSGDVEPLVINASGPQDDLTAVVETLVNKVLVGMKQEPSPAAWDQAREAEQFEQEAAWASRWEMWPEAYAAAQSAWALGRHTQPVATLQLKALIEPLRPQGYGKEDVGRHVVERDTDIYDPVLNAVFSLRPSDSTDVLCALEASGTFTGISRTAGKDWSSNKQWIALGSNILAKASAVVRHQYLYGWYSSKFDADLPELRAAARALADLLPRDRIRPLLLADSPYWQDSPTAAIDFWHTWMATGEFDKDRVSIVQRDASHPFWIGWSPKQREDGAREWRAFVTGLQNSTNRNDRANGFLLQLHDARFDDEIAQAVEQFLESTMDKERQKFTTEVDYTAMDSLEKLLRGKATQTMTLRRNRLVASLDALSFARIKNYLQTALIGDGYRVSQIAKYGFTVEQAKELASTAEEFSRRIDVIEAKGLTARLAQLASGSSETTKSALTTKSESQPVPQIAPADVLRVSRILNPRLKMNNGETSPIPIEKWSAIGNKVITLCPPPVYRNMLAPEARECRVTEIDPVSCEFRRWPQDITLDPNRPTTSFDVIGGHPYFIQGDGSIGEVQDEAGSLKEYAVALPLFRATLKAAGNRLFIIDDDYLAEFLIPTHEVKLLASRRRNPPQNQLEAWAGWASKPGWISTHRLWLGAAGTVFANVGGTNIWALNPASGEWHSADGTRDRTTMPWALSFNETTGECLDERVWLDGEREPLLCRSRGRLPRWPMPYDYPYTPDMGVFLFENHSFDGTNLWVLIKPKSLDQVTKLAEPVALKERDLTLLWFAADWELPFSIPLKFEREGRYARGPDYPLMPPGHWRCTAMEAGLVFGSSRQTEGIPGQEDTWFIPWTDLMAWVQKHDLKRYNLPREQQERLRKFDRNGNGQLGPDELATMRNDKVWQQEDAARESKRMLFAFDSNHDGRLDAGEMERLTTSANLRHFEPEFSPGFGKGWLHLRPDELLATFDTNHNGTVEDQELVALYYNLSNLSDSKNLANNH